MKIGEEGIDLDREMKIQGHFGGYAEEIQN